MSRAGSLIRVGVGAALAIAITPAAPADEGNPALIGPASGPIAMPHALPDGNAFRVNAAGVIAGAIQSDDRCEAIIWSPPAILQLGTLGGDFGIAFALNDNGLVVGQAGTDKVDRGGRRVAQAFVWDGGVMHNLSGARSWLDSAARGINAQGDIVGWVMMQRGDQRAALWPAASKQTAFPIELGTLGGMNSIAHAINVEGVIVGEAETEIFAPGIPPMRAFRYDPESGMSALPLLPEGINSAALDVNDKGVIVGWSESMNQVPIATLWLPDHAPIELGTFGGVTSVAYGINNRNEIAGMATVFVKWVDPPVLVAPLERAFVWREGKMTDLNTLLPADSGWLLLEARDINENGIVAGIGMFDGGQCAFRLDLNVRPVRPVRVSGVTAKL